MYRIVAICLQLILIDNTLAQFGPTLQPAQNVNQQLTNTPIPKQQLINCLLKNSNQASLADKIEVLTAAIQNIPPHRTNYQSDIFKQSALQSLRDAASYCDSDGNQFLNNLIANTGLQKVQYTNQAFAPNSRLPLSPQRSVLSLIEYAPSLRQTIGRKVVVANEPLLVANDLSLLSKPLVSGADYLPNRVSRFLI